MAVTSPGEIGGGFFTGLLTPNGVHGTENGPLGFLDAAVFPLATNPNGEWTTYVKVIDLIFFLVAALLLIFCRKDKLCLVLALLLLMAGLSGVLIGWD